MSSFPPNYISNATAPLSGTAWWIAFAITFTAAVVFAILSYIRNVKPEARLVRYFATPWRFGDATSVYILMQFTRECDFVIFLPFFFRRSTTS